MTLASLRKRVHYWQHHPSLAFLGLRGWELKVDWLDDTVEFEDEEVDSWKDTLAACEPHPLYDEADVRFNKEQLNEGNLDRAIVHELLHAFMRDFDEACVAGLADVMSAPGAKTFLTRLRHEREGVVDRLARTIVHLDRR